MQVDDSLSGKKKGFVDALPPGQELQADRGRALNPDTIHSDLDDIVTPGPSSGQELNLDRGRTPEGKFWQKEQGRPVGSAPLMRLGITQKRGACMPRRDRLQSLAQRHSVFAQVSELVSASQQTSCQYEGVSRNQSQKSLHNM